MTFGHGGNIYQVSVSLKTLEANRLVGANLRALADGDVLDSAEGRIAC
jgi:hypothetical protein